jgi:F0F1-type ATP synthase assembly protein I
MRGMPDEIKDDPELVRRVRRRIMVQAPFQLAMVVLIFAGVVREDGVLILIGGLGFILAPWIFMLAFGIVPLLRARKRDRRSTMEE